MVLRLMLMLVTALCAMIFFPTSADAQDKKILYVPIDNRPCNLFQVVQAAEKIGYEILTPPTEILGSNEFRGDPDKLWAWVNETAPQADFAVLSTDSLIYGSLVASRMHDLSKETITERVQRFATFHEKFPYLPTYALGTIMRTPRSGSHSSAEPEYYYTYGAKIFQYTALLDKQEMNLLTGRDERALKNLTTEIPAEYLDDWFKRRAKNSDANKYLTDLTRQGVFKYFLLGCDDSAEFSQTHRESRHLTEYSSDLGKTVIQVTSGADELGMLMISRAINEDRGRSPLVVAMYNDGKGAKTFPAYSNEPIGISIDAAITAVSGVRILSPENADLIIAVNTRGNGKTFEAATKKNTARNRNDVKTFVAPVKKFVDAGYHVAIADVSYSNGADNALMNQLKRDDLLYKIRAYGGWNTATNASGFLIGESVLTDLMSERDIVELLTTRYLDEWAYQANVRQEIVAASYGMAGEGTPLKLGDKVPALERLLNEKMNAFAEKNLKLPRPWRLENLHVTLPWHRTFECDPRFTLAG